VFRLDDAVGDLGDLPVEQGEPQRSDRQRRQSARRSLRPVRTSGGRRPQLTSLENPMAFLVVPTGRYVCGFAGGGRGARHDTGPLDLLCDLPAASIPAVPVTGINADSP